MLKNYALGKLLATVDVTEDEVKKFYEENKEAFKEKESANASHILVSEEDKAREIYEKVKDGEDFETLAKKNSTCPSKEKGGDLGTFTRGQMVKEFEDAVFENEVGTVTEPVKTQFGYHIIKINEKNEGRDLEFDEVKDKIFSQLKRQKEQDLYNKKIEELKEKYDVKMNV
ncbi:MAG: peptidylprolyl isomerase [Peptoniphilus harei]|nr:peptidylprolyl isomerase [Peptoniphilus harei]